MSRRSTRVVVAVVLVAAAIWCSSRPASAADAVEWRATVRDGPWDLGADAQGVVVTTSADSVYALTPGGRPRWRAAVAGLVLGEPAVGRDVVVVGGEHAVTALRRDDGSQRWTRATSAAVHAVAVAGSTVLAGDDAGTLSALDVRTGELRWTVQHPGALWSAPRVDRSSAAVVATWHGGAAPAVRVYDLARGTLRWAAPTERFTAAPVMRAGLVVVAAGDGDRHARVEARALTTGEVRWQTPMPASFEEAIEPAADDREVAVVDHFGVVSLLDLTSGRLRWRCDLADPVLTARLVLTSRRVAFASNAGVLHVLDRHDGHEVEHVEARRIGGVPVASAPAPGRPHGQVLLALRLRDWGVQRRRLP